MYSKALTHILAVLTVCSTIVKATGPDSKHTAIAATTVLSTLNSFTVTNSDPESDYWYDSDFDATYKTSFATNQMTTSPSQAQSTTALHTTMTSSGASATNIPTITKHTWKTTDTFPSHGPIAKCSGLFTSGFAPGVSQPSNVMKAANAPRTWEPIPASIYDSRGMCGMSTGLASGSVSGTGTASGFTTSGTAVATGTKSSYGERNARAAPGTLMVGFVTVMLCLWVVGKALLDAIFGAPIVKLGSTWNEGNLWWGF